MSITAVWIRATNVPCCRSPWARTYTLSLHDALPIFAVGKKIDQPLGDTHRIKFTFNVAASGADFMRVELGARKGPLGTHDYLIALELIALPDERSFIHIRYAYKQGLLARMATGAYFGSSGKHKVGFTVIDADQKRPAHLVEGVRGAVERNTMRYYLAIDAYLHSLGSPAPQRFEESVERWFATTERFAQQLHEVEHDDYIAMKRRQYLRQQSAESADLP